jgi:hypothetical protein
MQEVLSSSQLDDATTAQIAELLGGQAVKLTPRQLWLSFVPNTTMVQNPPLQNFVGFANQPGTPQPTSLLVVNAGDLAVACVQGFSIGVPQEIATELFLAWLIPGSTMSSAAQAAAPNTSIGNWPLQPGYPYWYTPPATSAPVLATTT